MNALNCQNNWTDPDATYEALIKMHEGLSVDASLKVSINLILLLSNHIGDHAVLAEAMAQARKSLDAEQNTTPIED